MTVLREYDVRVELFDEGGLKDKARKLVEESAEAFSAYESWSGDPTPSNRRAIWHECCDVIQAACNLMADLGATSTDVAGAMYDVTTKNRERGRYDG